MKVINFHSFAFQGPAFAPVRTQVPEKVSGVSERKLDKENSMWAGGGQQRAWF